MYRIHLCLKHGIWQGSFIPLSRPFEGHHSIKNLFPIQDQKRGKIRWFGAAILGENKHVFERQNIVNQAFIAKTSLSLNSNITTMLFMDNFLWHYLSSYFANLRLEPKTFALSNFRAIIINEDTSLMFPVIYLPSLSFCLHNCYP